MGLDNYASRTPDEVTLSEEDQAAFESAGIDLCGGIHSDGSTSFRGKMYWDLVLEVTGESLHREWLPPAVVQRMAAALASHTPAALAATNDGVRARAGEHSTFDEEMAELQRFFAICAERGLGLIAWS
ncbi:MAG: hypothetical protein ABIJ48_05755 [Actinomycetota bacterium]